MSPYVLPVFEAVDNPLYKTVCFICGAQMSKTQTSLAVMGYRLEDDPVPMIFLGPTRDMVDRMIEPRIQHMLESVPALNSTLVKGRRAKKLGKEVRGVTINMAWAGSATQVSSQTAALTYCDEPDRMEEIKGEGDPIALLERRMEQYPDGTMLITCTPTEGTLETFIHPETGMEHWQEGDAEFIFSRSWLVWRAGTRHEYMIPCDGCSEYFSPRFRHCHWPEQGTALERAEAARLCCPRCGHEHDDNAIFRLRSPEYGRAVAPGQWVDENRVVQGEPPKTKTYSLWASGLLSITNAVKGRVYDWLRAVESGETGSMQAVINTGFGELWAVSGERPKVSIVDECVAEYERDTVPDDAHVLFMGVDVQKDRLEYVIRAFGYRMTSWLVSHGQIYGDPEQGEIWDDLEVLSNTLIDGRRIIRVGVDAGYLTQRVVEFADRDKLRYIATMGAAKGLEKVHWQISDRETDEKGRRRKRKKGGVSIMMLNTDFTKSWVYDRMARRDEHGRWYVYKGVDEEYKKQVTAEARMPKRGGGYIWKRLGENHKLDCEAIIAFLANYTNKLFAEIPPRKPDKTNTTATAAPKPRRMKTL